MVLLPVVTIAGTAYDDFERAEVKKSLGSNNAGGNFAITFDNYCGYHSSSFNIADVVVITVDGNNIISGSIGDIEFRGQGNKEVLVLRGRDYTSYLQDITVKPEVFNNTEISQIVIDIISGNVSGITTNNVNSTGIIITKSFNHQPVFDAIKELAEQAGYIFYIDSDKDLHFEQKSSVSSGITLNFNNVTKSNFRTVDREMANSVYVYGGDQLVGWENSFTANGGSVYTLEYKPHDTRIFIGGSTTPKQGDVLNFITGDVGSPTQYLVDFDNRSIVFVSGTDAGNNIPVSGTDTIKIEYNRRSRTAKVAVDEISKEMYGLKDKVIVDKNITDPDDAVNIAKKEILERSSPIVQGILDVNTVYNVTPGNTVIVNQPYQNVNNATYEIIEADYDFTKEKIYNNNVLTLRVSKRVIDLTDTIKNMALDIKKIQAETMRDSSILTRIQASTGSFGFRVADWKVSTRTIGNSFILGHPVNGVLGSPQVGINGSQVTLGSSSFSAWTVERSGNDL